MHLPQTTKITGGIVRAKYQAERHTRIAPIKALTTDTARSTQAIGSSASIIVDCTKIVRSLRDRGYYVERFRSVSTAFDRHIQYLGYCCTQSLAKMEFHREGLLIRCFSHSLRFGVSFVDEYIQVLLLTHALLGELLLTLTNWSDNKTKLMPW